MAYYIFSAVISTGITLDENNMYISSGGAANSTTVNSGGGMYISSGGTANSTTVSSRGSMFIYVSGTAMTQQYLPAEICMFQAAMLSELKLSPKANCLFPAAR